MDATKKRPPGKILNPLSGRYVLRTGKLGKSIIKRGWPSGNPSQRPGTKRHREKASGNKPLPKRRKQPPLKLRTLIAKLQDYFRQVNSLISTVGDIEDVFFNKRIDTTFALTWTDLQNIINGTADENIYVACPPTYNKIVLLENGKFPIGNGKSWNENNHSEKSPDEYGDVPSGAYNTKYKYTKWPWIKVSSELKAYLRVHITTLKRKAKQNAKQAKQKAKQKAKHPPPPRRPVRELHSTPRKKLARVVGVSPSSPEFAKRAKRAYKLKAFKLHPDKNKNPNSQAKFQAFNLEYSEAKELYNKKYVGNTIF